MSRSIEVEGLLVDRFVKACIGNHRGASLYRFAFVRLQRAGPLAALVLCLLGGLPKLRAQ